MIACISGALGPLEEPRQREVNLATATAIRFFQGLPPHVLLAFLFLLFVLTFFYSSVSRCDEVVLISSGRTKEGVMRASARREKQQKKRQHEQRSGIEKKSLSGLCTIFSEEEEEAGRPARHRNSVSWATRAPR